MAKTKPITLATGHRTKEEIQQRRENEERLRGSSNKVHIAPKWLCKDGMKEYKKLVKDLDSSGILTNVDIPVVAIIADAYAKMSQANSVLKEEGMFIKKTSDRGAENIVEHPAMKVYRQYNTIYKQYLVEVGLSPSSRAKLSVINTNAEDDRNDPLLAILNK
ncbi:phage terminase small subunit P27 family [Romboutsia sp. 1001216sp1]|uniref:phage terminase small subunit P27 family n=1 Tax=unclassified Romboutsia TaxID=2626894 RepID=UPI0018AAE79C|nr:MULTISPECIES: phage terminase small subunit P27 family [unclassified Romboutsia]MDB8794282.1 phage terminase small subunit P27 family [Romboutsia sp. 1001216sp1]MDB8796451.1 phage terminase small subunit P27 family [Romboutsia sp. 1001216sp1]MDB8797796.1 phage terminase small subunit P27 family [Romboutsia sp. 1001216sp1]